MGALNQGYLFPPHYGGEAIFHFPPRVSKNGGEVKIFFSERGGGTLKIFACGGPNSIHFALYKVTKSPKNRACGALKSMFVMHKLFNSMLSHLRQGDTNINVFRNRRRCVYYCRKYCLCSCPNVETFSAIEDDASTI